MDELNASVAPWEDDFAQSGEIDPERSVSETADEPVSPEKAILADEIASEFIGFWNRLVSQTNWEKGRVINTWRTKLLDAQLPRSLWSDESISRRIGNVSSQHVGRLRRVFERFGDAACYRENDRFANLYWSHYQAALDWDDAEEWLEKASNELLSVALMRIARWEKYGAPASKKPKPEEIISAEPDEDVNPMNDSDADIIDIGSMSGDTADDARTSEKKKKTEENAVSDEQAFDYSGDPEIGAELDRVRGSDEVWTPPVRTTDDVLRTFSELPKLPDELADPMNSVKMAILDQRLAGWDAETQESAVAWLRRLAELAAAKDDE